MKFILNIILPAFICCLMGCPGSKTIEDPVPPVSTDKLKLLGEYIIPYDLSFKGTTIGGLSGIDYDVASGLYYLISDDRSNVNDARFYTAKIFTSAKGVDSVTWVDVQSLKQPNGNVFPKNAVNTPDPEAIRFNPLTQQITWSSEGDRNFSATDSLLIHPFIYTADKTGRFTDSFFLPNSLKMSKRETGPRQNLVLEGLAFTDNYKTLFASLEGPLYQDWDGTATSKQYSRFYKFDAAARQLTGEYVYQLDSSYGVSDILALSNTQLLVTERYLSRIGFTTKFYLADLTTASSINDTVSLIKNPPASVMAKKIYLNFDGLGRYIDNIEGATFGPDLPNGHKTILFVADNNFLQLEKQQLLLFEYTP